MKQNSQQIFLEFLIAENRELKAFIKSVVEKSLKIDNSWLPAMQSATSGYMAPISDFYDKDKNVMHPSYGGTINLNNLGEVRTTGVNPIGKSAIDIAKERIEKIPAETPEEKLEKEDALKQMNNIFGLD